MIFEDTFPRFQNRLPIDKAYFADETQCVNDLLRHIAFSADDIDLIAARARSLVEIVREKSRNMGGISAFMQQYDLSSQEGVVLLCLAEALLRIPDSDTADRLIKDKLAHAEWEKYVGRSQSLFVNASTWGLMLTGHIMSMNDMQKSDYTAIVNNIIARISEPVVRAALREAMRIMGHQFVMGRNIEEAITRSKEGNNQAFRYSFDMLGEAALTSTDADHYFNVYIHAIEAIAKTASADDNIFTSPSISVKLSALHPRFEFSKRERLVYELIPRVKQLANVARDANIAMTIDGEEADRLDITLDVIESILSDKSYDTWAGLGMVVQAYQKRAPQVIDWLEQLLGRSKRSMTVRLVKGAYWDTEIKRAQEQGLEGYPVYTRKQHTDVSYLACARKLLDMTHSIYPQFATHNAHTASAILHMVPDKVAFEFQRLHGMGEVLHHEILQSSSGAACRVYAPVGSHKDLLPYLVRRLLENGANTSFVNRITDERIPVEDIIADPVAKVMASDRTPHENIPLPVNIYGDERINSRGVAFSNTTELQEIQRQLNKLPGNGWHAAPVINGQVSQGESRQVSSPANNEHVIGEVEEAGPETVEQALEIACQGFNTWEKRPVSERAECLGKVAELYEQHTDKLVSLIMMEGGRCVTDAIAEIREAVDFCRYYAALARKRFSMPELLPGPTGESNELSLHGRGVFLCISPWNFPIAIFTGQIAAALVTGNSVIAKPASQTSLVAMQAIQLMLQAGVPGNVLQFLPGPGSLLGERLIKDRRVAGVAFTGSTDTANKINLNLAQRGGAIVPFIAETGGQNAMIVDSSALPEQVVNDVVKSAFNSAGQRCSALRVLFLQEQIAPRIIELLKGAIAELKVGDPVYLSTDMGPVIDRQAVENLNAHIQVMSKNAKLIYQQSEPSSIQRGSFVMPCAFQIDSLSQLQQEVFGPVLHVITYSADKLDKVIDAINDTSYGLTLGIHSRIEEKARYIQQRVHVGNIYVNRNMIGASVGVQPFGGEGLSGTGPKAGGPHYLYRFSTERVLTTNCAAIGGNASLLTLE